jgi:hypothetical protein
MIEADGPIIHIRCRLFASATMNEKWEEGCMDAINGRPSNAAFYNIKDLKRAYVKGYAYGLVWKENAP